MTGKYYNIYNYDVHKSFSANLYHSNFNDTNMNTKTGVLWPQPQQAFLSYPMAKFSPEVK